MTDGPSVARTFSGLDADVAALLDAAASAGLVPLVELDPSAARERVSGGDRLVAAGPDVAEVTQVVVPRADGDVIPVRRYLPHRITTDLVLVWLHGGGWTTGDLEYSDAFCRQLADGLGCVVHSVDYRLAPEHRFPAAVDDALAAARWSATGGRPIVLGGDSAGGNLAAVCAQQLRGRAVEVIAQLLVYPVVDDDITRASYVRNGGLVLGAAEMTWFFDHYAPRATDRASARFAPIRARTLRSLPPAVIAVAGHDPLHDEGVAYADALRAAGVPVSLLDAGSLVHGFLRFTAVVPAARRAAADIVVAMRDLLAGSGQAPSAIDFSSR